MKDILSSNDDLNKVIKRTDDLCCQDTWEQLRDEMKKDTSEQ
jgi:hypothetical protein